MVEEKGDEPFDGRGEKEKEMIVNVICPHCQFSKGIPLERIPTGVKWAICPQCRQRFRFDDMLPDRGMASETPRRGSSPWERRSEIGLWAGIHQTCRAVLFHPTRFFRSTAVQGGLREPLAFALLTGSAGMMLEVFWQLIFLGEDVASLTEGLLGPFGTAGMFLLIMALCPLFMLLAILVTSLIIHLLLVIVRGGKSGFEATFRVVSFTQASQLFGLIPFIGGLFGTVWLIGIQVIGLREMHEASYFKVATALVLPVIVLLILLIALRILGGF